MPHFPAEFDEAPGPRADRLRLSALDQAAAIRDGAFKSAELVEMYLERIARHDGRVGAFVHVMAERARRDAAEKDRLRASGRALPPFHGVPVAVKDLHMLRAAPVRFGSRAWRHLWSPVDDLTVRALRRAGFVIVGKTATSELALLPVVETDIHPPCRNPWAPDHTSGGSSGGAAAAVAAGLIPISPGSDGGGSVRIPASVCGLVGLKPTRAAIPNPHAPVDFLGMTAIGPLALSVDDAAGLADVLCGRPPGTPGSWLAAARTPPKAGLKIALWLQCPLDVETAPSHVAAVRSVVARLEALGHGVTPIPPVPVALDEFLPIYQRLFTKTPVIFESKLQPVTAWFRTEGNRHTDAQVRAALTRLAGLADAADHGFDLLVCPTLPIQAPFIGAHGDLGPEAYFRALAPMGGFTAAWNVTGRPALTLPWGFDWDGLPIGVQFVGRAGDDPRLLALARQLEGDPARREIYPMAPGA